MTKKYDVLVVGELNVDIILNDIDGLPELGKEKIAEQLTVTLGSSSAIFASNLSTLGTSTAFVGKLGKDTHAEIIKTALKMKYVNTDFLLETDRYKTGVTIVLNYDTDRANITYPGAMNHLSVDEITDKMLGEIKHMHLSSVFMQPSLKPDVVKLFRRAKAHGLTTSMDPQWDPSEEWDLDIKELLPFIDIFMPNTVEFKAITRSESIIKGINKVKEFANTIIIKDGTNGAHMWNDHSLITSPSFNNASIVDCIGAGDSFNAGFINQFIQGIPLEECMKFGNLIGAINTTGHGGTGAFKNLEEIKTTAIKRFSTKI